MSITPTKGVIFQNITTADNQYAAVATSKCAGLLTFDIDEDTMTSKMKKELIGAVISVYTKLSSEATEYIKVATKTVLWRNNIDRAVAITGIPRECYLKIEPLLDKRIAMYTDDDGVTQYDIIPELYIQMSEHDKFLAQQHLTTTFPVSVTFDGTCINGGGGSATLDGAIIDNPTSDDTVSAAQVYNFANDIDDLTYDG